MAMRMRTALLAATAWLLNVAAADEAPLSATHKRKVVEQLGAALEANYVVADKA